MLTARARTHQRYAATHQATEDSSLPEHSPSLAGTYSEAVIQTNSKSLFKENCPG